MQVFAVEAEGGVPADRWPEGLCLQILASPQRYSRSHQESAWRRLGTIRGMAMRNPAPSPTPPEAGEIIGTEKPGAKRLIVFAPGRQAAMIRAFLDAEREADQFLDHRNENITTHKADLPPLRGSEKQLGWATEIRNWRMNQFFTYGFPLVKGGIVMTSHLPSGLHVEAGRRVLACTSAHWWIETRALDPRALLERALDDLPTIAPKPTEGAQAEMDRATMRPENVNGPLCEVSIDQRRVRVVMGFYSEQTNAVVKSLGFRWESNVWQIAMADHSDAMNQATESAVRLLAAGCPILALDEALRARVIANDYKPDPRLRVELSVSEKWGRKFMVTWARSSGIDQAITRVGGIRGARLFTKGGGAFVPLSQFEQIEDLANGYGFKILPEAAKAIEAERAKAAAALGIRPEVKRTATPEIDRPPALSGTGEIDASLRDD